MLNHNGFDLTLVKVNPILKGPLGHNLKNGSKEQMTKEAMIIKSNPVAAEYKEKFIALLEKQNPLHEEKQSLSALKQNINRVEEEMAFLKNELGAIEYLDSLHGSTINVFNCKP